MPRTTAPAAPAAAADLAGWTFLSNYAHVIILLARTPDLRMRDVAQQVGITERGVQRIVADLMDAGFLTATRVGRRNTYQVALKARLRHPIEAHRTIADLVALGS
jgi:DNA-binding IclR family transcriptional regulator